MATRRRAADREPPTEPWNPYEAPRSATEESAGRSDRGDLLLAIVIAGNLAIVAVCMTLEAGQADRLGAIVVGALWIVGAMGLGLAGGRRGR